MFRDNLAQLRKLKGLTQEDIADRVGVSRQAVARWESGDSVPDIDKCRIIAEMLDVSLDDLVNYEPPEGMNPSVPPKGKYLFGIVKVGDKGQIVIPAKARKIFKISAGDMLLVLGEEGSGIALVHPDTFVKQ